MQTPHSSFQLEHDALLHDIASTDNIRCVGLALRAQSIYTALIQLKLGRTSECHQVQNQPGEQHLLQSRA
jgi:hypothetical protein